MPIAIGQHRGHRVHRVVRPKAYERKESTKNHLFVKDVIREVCGYAPYERRVMELLRNGLDKRALRLTKRKLGSITRAKAKREELNQLMQKARLERLAHQDHHHHEDPKKKKAQAKKAAKKEAKKAAAATEQK